MGDVNESYPTPTVGTSITTVLELSGSGITTVSESHVYQVTLSLNGTSTVAVTAVAEDNADGTQSLTGNPTWTCYEASPSSLTVSDPNGVTESYPAGATLGGVASVGTGNPATVTALNKGQAVVECRWPSFVNTTTGANPIATGFVYAQLLVNVTA